MSSFLRALSDAPASLPVPAHDLHALPPDSRPTRGLLHADVCVVDGGLLGLAAATALARAGRCVILLKAVRVGAGASGRNGGQVLAGFVCPDERLAGVLDASAAAEAWWLGREDPLILSVSGGPLIGSNCRASAGRCCSGGPLRSPGTRPWRMFWAL